LWSQEPLVYTLKRLKYSPIALGRNRSIGELFIPDGIPFISVDLTNREETIEAFRGADYVIHCAGLSSVWGAKSEFHKANVMAVKHVIEACQIHHIKRLIHISTPSLYFDYQDKYNLTECDLLPKTCVNDYASSKKEGENLVQQAFHRGLPIVILRPRGIFGPGDTTIFPRILSAMDRKMLPLINEGKSVMDITYVDNVVDAIILAMHARNIEGQVYNITNDEPKSFIELLQLLSEKMQLPLKTRNISFKKAYYSAKVVECVYRLLRLKKEPPITCYGVGLVAKSMTFDINKAKKELGYQPRVSIEEGLDAFAAWWRAPC
jgi:nucleoside-diphosphate-sugar epimerase